jgi:hypothetical protein
MLRSHGNKWIQSLSDHEEREGSHYRRLRNGVTRFSCALSQVKASRFVFPLQAKPVNSRKYFSIMTVMRAGLLHFDSVRVNEECHFRQNVLTNFRFTIALAPEVRFKGE